MIKLKDLIKEQEQPAQPAQFYDLGKDFTGYQRAKQAASEEVRSRFEKAMNDKLKGKNVRARASKGQPKQFEKDYDIEGVSKVSIANYYGREEVIVATDKNGKEYFLRPGFKVQITGAGETSPEDQEAPEEEPKTKAPAEPPTPQLGKPSEQPQGTPQGEPPMGEPQQSQQPSKVPPQQPQQPPQQPQGAPKPPVPGQPEQPEQPEEEQPQQQPKRR